MRHRPFLLFKFPFFFCSAFVVNKRNLNWEINLGKHFLSHLNNVETVQCLREKGFAAPKKCF